MKSIAVILAIIVSACIPVGAADANPTIQVMGEGTVTVPADMVTIAATVESNNENSTVAEAQAQNMLNETIQALRNAGVEEKDISASSGSGVSSFQSSSKVCRTVNNNTTCDYESLASRTVSKSLLIRLQTMDQSRINSVLNAAKSAGASADVTGYGLSDAQTAVADAHKAAVADAKKNADDIAAAAGGKLGKVIDISQYGPPYIGSSDQQGMVDVTSMVLSTYELI